MADELVVDRETGAVQRIPIAGEALAAVRDGDQVAQEADAPVALRDEVAYPVAPRRRGWR